MYTLFPAILYHYLRPSQIENQLNLFSSRDRFQVAFLCRHTPLECSRDPCPIRILVSVPWEHSFLCSALARLIFLHVPVKDPRQGQPYQGNSQKGNRLDRPCLPILNEWHDNP